MRTVEEFDRDRSDSARAVVARADNFVVTDHARFRSHVLQTGEHGMVAGASQGVHNMLLVIVHAETAMSQAEHAITMRTHSCQQGGAAW